MHRRRFVAALASGLGAGCTSLGGSSGEVGQTPTQTATARPTSTPHATPSGFVRPASPPGVVPRDHSCETASGERLSAGYEDVAWGDAAGFALRVTDLAVAHGETATIELRNVSTETRSTGLAGTFNLELYTESGWREVRARTTALALPYPAEAVLHDPGEGFEWRIELTESGIEAASYHDDAVTVCPALPAGRYRFVYWGLGESSVAVAFELERPDSA